MRLVMLVQWPDVQHPMMIIFPPHWPISTLLLGTDDPLSNLSHYDSFSLRKAWVYHGGIASRDGVSVVREHRDPGDVTRNPQLS